MLNPRNEEWQKKFQRLTTKHYADQNNLKSLTQQLHRLMLKHTKLKCNVAEEGQKYMGKLELMDQLRAQLDGLLRANNNKLTPEMKRKLMKLNAQLPTDSLLDRIKLMELSSQMHKYQESVDPQGNWLQYIHMREKKQLFRHVCRRERALKRLNAKIMLMISDIHDLNASIQFVKVTPASKLKVKLFAEHLAWLQAPKPHRSPTHSVNHMLYHPYIRNRIHKLMPDMYNYLDVK